MMRYDHAAMAEHATRQASLVTQMSDLQQQANRAIHAVAEIWTQHGSNAAQECHAQIAMAFQQVFDTINRHGTAIAGASSHAEISDLGAAAGFRGL